MQIIEILRTCGDFLETLHKFGIKIDDYRYLGMYSDYEKMHQKGYKMTYIVAVLAERYDMCERKVYKVIKRMSANCQKRAVQ